MKSLFNKTDNQEMIDRINKLGSNSKAQWGKMNVSQMVLHMQQPLRVAFGELKLKRTFIGILFGGIAKKKLAGPQPFPRDMPTDKNFIVSTKPNFEVEKKKLIILVQRFAEKGPSGIMQEPHPFFGKLTTQEWDSLQWKHLDHHLRQFEE